MHREGSTKIESVAGSINVFWKASAMGMESVVGSFHGIESVADSMFVPTQTHIPAWWVLSSSPSVWFIWFVVSSWQCFVHLWCSECQILGYPCNFSWIGWLHCFHLGRFSDLFRWSFGRSVIFSPGPSGFFCWVQASRGICTASSVCGFATLLVASGFYSSVQDALGEPIFIRLQEFIDSLSGFSVGSLFFCPGCPSRVLSRLFAGYQELVTILKFLTFFLLKQKRHIGNGGLIPFSCRNAWRIVRQVLWTPRGGSWIRFFTTAKNNICTTVMRIVNVSSPLSGDFFLRVFLRVYSNGLTIYVSVFFDRPVGLFDDVPSPHIGCGNLRRD